MQFNCDSIRQDFPYQERHKHGNEQWTSWTWLRSNSYTLSADGHVALQVQVIVYNNDNLYSTRSESVTTDRLGE